MVRKTLVAVAAVVGLLAGCSAVPAEDELVVSTVDRSTIPAFLDEPQAEGDLITCDAVLGVEPESTRYQGSWNGNDIYLGVMGGSTVHVITITPGDEPVCGSGSSIGNSVIGLGDPLELQYLPQGSAEPPSGWHAFSDWMIVKEIEG